MQHYATLMQYAKLCNVQLEMIIQLKEKAGNNTLLHP